MDGPSSHDDYPLEGLLRCQRCHGPMAPAPGVEARFYSCGPGCPQPDMEAIPVEQDLLLHALARAYVALHGVGRHTTVRFTAPEDFGNVDDGAPVSGEETRRWQSCETSSPRAVLRTAYQRVDVDETGQARPVWRHHTETSPEAPAAT